MSGRKWRDSSREETPRLAAIKRLAREAGPGPVADGLARLLLSDDDSPALSALVEDLIAAPTLGPDEIRRIGTAQWTTLDEVRRRSLSPRQRDALRALAHGAPTYEALGEEIGVATGSVAEHLLRARARLGAASNAHAAALGIGMGLFEAPARIATEGRFVARSLLRPRRRESLVLERLARGESNEEIAARLGLSTETVKDYISDLLDLYGARNRAHLIASAFAAGTLRFVSSRPTEEAA